MYKHLQSIAAFVTVAETGAFNKAAKVLGVKASVVSHHVSKLEDYLGTTLIYRTTRKLALSEHGRILFEAGRQWIEGTGRALDQIMDAQEEAIGALNVALPAFMPDPAVETAILNFVQLHPNVSVTLNYSDVVVDVLGDHCDLSIRVGEPPDSSFVGRKLSSISHILVASPDFLLQHGSPQEPEHLSSMPHVATEGVGDIVTLARGHQRAKVQTTICQIATNNIYGARAAAQNGLGIANLPTALCEASLAEGKLVRILPEWQLPAWPLQAIWPDSSRRTTLTKRLVDHIVSTKNKNGR